MITDANRKVSIIAYFISKFDMDAVKALGYGTYTDAFEAYWVKFITPKTHIMIRFAEPFRLDTALTCVTQGRVF